jgi:hypothetical protein
MSMAAVGTFVGGAITWRLKLGVDGCIKMALGCLGSATCFACLLLVFGCDNPVITGLDTTR